jgi:hypothetical protein
MGTISIPARRQLAPAATQFRGEVGGRGVRRRRQGTHHHIVTDGIPRGQVSGDHVPETPRNAVPGH